MQSITILSLRGSRMKKQSKRSFLIGGAGVICTAITSPVWALQQKFGFPTFTSNYDVVVIGAGFSGIIAARELGVLGYKVLVLESSSQLGGKKNDDGWLHPIQPYVARELQTYNMTLAEVKSKVDDIMLSNALEKLTEEASSACQQSSKSGRLTLNHVSNMHSSELDAFKRFSDVLEGIYGQPLSLKHLSTLLALVDGKTGELATVVNTYYLENGISDFRNRILQSSRADLVFNSKVSSVISAGDGFQIVTGDRNVFARGVVVSVPSQVSNGIYFDPTIYSNAAQNGIVWSGADTAMGLVGFVDGAIESGFKASISLHEYL
jgi:monoamine oxidase